MNGSNAVAGNYFFCNSYDQIYYISSVSWNEFSEVIRAESRPNAEKDMQANITMYQTTFIIFMHQHLKSYLGSNSKLMLTSIN